MSLEGEPGGGHFAGYEEPRAHRMRDHAIFSRRFLLTGLTGRQRKMAQPEVLRN